MKTALSVLGILMLSAVLNFSTSSKAFGQAQMQHQEQIQQCGSCQNETEEALASISTQDEMRDHHCIRRCERQFRYCTSYCGVHHHTCYARCRWQYDRCISYCH